MFNTKHLSETNKRVSKERNIQFSTKKIDKNLFSSSTFWQLSVLIDTPLHVKNVVHGPLALFIICLEGCKGMATYCCKNNRYNNKCYFIYADTTI